MQSRPDKDSFLSPFLLANDGFHLLATDGFHLPVLATDGCYLFLLQSRSDKIIVTSLLATDGSRLFLLSSTEFILLQFRSDEES
jgi:hypothetical protein